MVVLGPPSGAPRVATGLVGTGGASVIVALGGRDTIFGLGGNDTICGGPGNDTINGGAGADTVDFGGAPGGVNASLAVGIATGEGFDVLVGIENMIGSPFGDTLTGSGGQHPVGWRRQRLAVGPQRGRHPLRGGRQRLAVGRRRPGHPQRRPRHGPPRRWCGRRHLHAGGGQQQLLRAQRDGDVGGPNEASKPSVLRVASGPDLPNRCWLEPNARWERIGWVPTQGLGSSGQVLVEARAGPPRRVSAPANLTLSPRCCRVSALPVSARWTAGETVRRMRHRFRNLA